MLARYVLASACEREVVHTREKWPKYAKMFAVQDLFGYTWANVRLVRRDNTHSILQ